VWRAFPNSIFIDVKKHEFIGVVRCQKKHFAISADGSIVGLTSQQFKQIRTTEDILEIHIKHLAQLKPRNNKKSCVSRTIDTRRLLGAHNAIEECIDLVKLLRQCKVNAKLLEYTGYGGWNVHTKTTVIMLGPRNYSTGIRVAFEYIDSRYGLIDVRWLPRIILLSR
jgi:hypothetical protein